MTRRMCFSLFSALFTWPAFAGQKLGDDEWMRRFRLFVKAFNAFVEQLNEGSFDISTWHTMRRAWKELDTE